MKQILTLVCSIILFMCGKCCLWSRQKESIDGDQEMAQRLELLDLDIEMSDKNAKIQGKL